MHEALESIEPLPLAISSLNGPSPTPTLGGVYFSLLLSGLLLELHVAKVHDTPSQLVNTNLLFSAEAQYIKGNLQGHREEKAENILASHSRVEATALPLWGGTNEPLQHGMDSGSDTS